MELFEGLQLLDDKVFVRPKLGRLSGSSSSRRHEALSDERTPFESILYRLNLRTDAIELSDAAVAYGY